MDGSHPWTQYTVPAVHVSGSEKVAIFAARIQVTIDPTKKRGRVTRRGLTIGKVGCAAQNRSRSDNWNILGSVVVFQIAPIDESSGFVTGSLKFA